MQKRSDDSFAVSMSLTELAFLLIFVFLVISTFKSFEADSQPVNVDAKGESPLAPEAQEVQDPNITDEGDGRLGPNPEEDLSQLNVRGEQTNPEVNSGSLEDPPLTQASDEPESSTPERESQRAQTEHSLGTKPGACWEDENGTTEPLFEIKIDVTDRNCSPFPECLLEQKVIHITRLWGAHRNEQVRGAGWDALITDQGSVSFYQYETTAKKILDSVKDENGNITCMHYYRWWNSDIKDQDLRQHQIEKYLYPFPYKVADY